MPKNPAQAFTAAKATARLNVPTLSIPTTQRIEAEDLPTPRWTGHPKFTFAVTERGEGFSSEDFSLLSVNEHFRYARSSNRVGHAAIFTNPHGKTHAWQWHLPGGADGAPSVVGLHDFEAIKRFGRVVYRAKDADGKTWYSKRTTHAHVKLDGALADTELDLAYFSEGEDEKEPFWGSSKRTNRFKNRDAERIGHMQKGGHWMTINYESVVSREAQGKRSKSQNEVMGRSARDAYEEYFGEMEDTLAPEMKEILQRAFLADIRKYPECQYRPEWLHAYAHSLTPLEVDPQVSENLGAAPKWTNTEMMVLERIAKWFTLKQERGTTVKIKTLFEMLGESELINVIKFDVSVEFHRRCIHFMQELDAFQKFPVFRKASDLAQATGISYALLHGVPPVSQQIVRKEPDAPRSSHLHRRHRFFKPQEARGHASSAVAATAEAEASSESLTTRDRRLLDRNLTNKNPLSHLHRDTIHETSHPTLK
ncbi:hypothetical protein [Legionella impletisoli]|uniref:Uncharacterized protein n=1 Tax=Legionella impletisoli TaxID=343510 RepID=A0A917N8B5_9GAMM|nr:hypothetical protein [Legionella impletisoli]GGI77367.1 hypothetical protein GCM10007966_02650 [Legionella impletisoli]